MAAMDNGRACQFGLFMIQRQRVFCASWTVPTSSRYSYMDKLSRHAVNKTFRVCSDPVQARSAPLMGYGFMKVFRWLAKD